MSVGRRAARTRPTRRTGVKPCQLRRSAQLVQEHPAWWVEVALPNPPPTAMAHHIGAALLGSPSAPFFLRVQSISFSSEWMVPIAAFMLCSAAKNARSSFNVMSFFSTSLPRKTFWKGASLRGRWLRWGRALSSPAVHRRSSAL